MKRLFTLLFVLALCVSVQGQSLKVSSFPDGAHVAIDGNDTGKLTPANIGNLTLGNHTLSVSYGNWQTYSSTVDIVSGVNYATATLTPLLTVGPKGDKGDAGIGIQGPVGPAGIGIQGPVGPAGASAFGGIWSASKTYSQGQAVLRTAGIGSVGPFFNITGNNASDPASDSVNWVYCCGTPSLGYTPFASSGSWTNADFAPSTQNVLQYTFNNENAQQFSTLTISNLTGSYTTANTTTTSTPPAACYNPPPAVYGYGDTPAGPLPSCSSIGFSGVPASECTFIAGGQDAYGNNWTEYSCKVTTTSTATNTYTMPAITFAVLHNGTATGLSVSGASGTITATSQTPFAAGDTITLQIINPTSFTLNASANWELQ